MFISAKTMVFTSLKCLNVFIFNYDSRHSIIMTPSSTSPGLPDIFDLASRIHLPGQPIEVLVCRGHFFADINYFVSIPVEVPSCEVSFNISETNHLVTDSLANKPLNNWLWTMVLSFWLLLLNLGCLRWAWCPKLLQQNKLCPKFLQFWVEYLKFPKSKRATPAPPDLIYPPLFFVEKTKWAISVSSALHYYDMHIYYI